MLLRQTILVLLTLFLISVPIVAQQQASKQSGTAETKEQAVDATPTPTPTTPADSTQTPPPLQADERLPFMAESSNQQEQAAPSTGGLMLRTLGALLLIVGLIVAAAWGMKKFGGARFGKVAEDAPELSILNTVALGDKRSLAIVRFGNRNLLLGSTAQSITVLADEKISENEFRSVADMLSHEPFESFADELTLAENGGETV